MASWAAHKTIADNRYQKTPPRGRRLVAEEAEVQWPLAEVRAESGGRLGLLLTLRGVRAWEFIDRLVSLALPRIRDFRGLSDKQFDGNGNYTFGVQEQSIFHEINQDKIDRVRGFDITIVTSAKTDAEGRALLRHLGFPFRGTEQQA